jgi:hypothetical protein
MAFKVIAGEVTNEKGFTNGVILKVNTETGFTWRLVEDKDGSYKWESVK